MKLPYSWLKEYVKTKYSAAEIAEKLTMAGLEVEEVVSEVVFTSVVIGEVISKEKHPNADKLNVAVVRVIPPRHPELDSGSRKIAASQVPRNDEGLLQIVCGAPNLATGQKVPVALVGAKLGDFEIGKAKLRGIESNGMICSEKELGISEEHDGIMVLEQDAPVGADFGEYLGHEEVIDVDVLANRPDCMSIIGLSREVSALTGEKILLPKVVISEEQPVEKVTVTVEDKDLCPRYTSRVVKNVSYTETPGWMRERLLACGIRSIDLLVDISNYVMLEYGQPLHFFDLDKLKSLVIPVIDSEVSLIAQTRRAKAGIQEKDGSLGLPARPEDHSGGRPGMTGGGVEIIVRKAVNGEEITTLDGIKRKLTTDNLVIADSRVPIALAGVMGGLTTEIDKNTKNIFIEAAVFDKASIRKTSRSLGLRSEAVARYEKGIGLASPLAAIDRAAQLLSELAGGSVCAGVSDSFEGKVAQKLIELEISSLNKFLGTNYADALVSETLKSLGFTLKSVASGKYQVMAPEWRVDIAENVDLYEEVARVVGFESVPSTLPRLQVTPKKNKLYDFTFKVRNILAGIGFSEIMTYSFVSEKALLAVGEKITNAYEVANPMVKEQKYMRTTLVPAMLESLVGNQYNAESVHFYEIAKTFKRSGKELPQESTVLSIGVLGGVSYPFQATAGVNYFDAKGALESVLGFLSLSDAEFVSTSEDYLAVGHAAKIVVDGRQIGVIGEVSSTVSAEFGLKKPAAVAQIDLELLMELLPNERIYREIGKYQHSVRDISFVSAPKVESIRYLRAVEAGHKLIKNAVIADVYEAKNGEVNLTIRVTIASNEKTLTDKEVENAVSICQNEVAKLGGKIRGV